MPSGEAINGIKKKAKYIGNFLQGKRDEYECMY
jgi:hypothetical protein